MAKLATCSDNLLATLQCIQCFSQTHLNTSQNSIFMHAVCWLSSAGGVHEKCAISSVLGLEFWTIEVDMPVGVDMKGPKPMPPRLGTTSIAAPMSIGTSDPSQCHRLHSFLAASQNVKPVLAEDTSTVVLSLHYTNHLPIFLSSPALRFIGPRTARAHMVESGTHYR